LEIDGAIRIYPVIVVPKGHSWIAALIALAKSGSGFGIGAGRGYTANFPLPVGTYDAAYERVFREGALPLVQAFDPDIIILETGANDGLRGIDPNLLRRNLDEIVSIIKANNIDIILAGMKMFPNLGPEYTPAFSKVYPDIAQKHDIPLIPFFLEGVAGQIQFNQRDRIHPNPEGTLRIVDHIYPYVLKSVKKHLNQ